MNCSPPTSACADLFFSEYVEGTGQSKALEIYNPTSSPINLGDYSIERYPNGLMTPSGGITTFKSSDIFLYGSQTVYGAVGNGVTVVGLTSTKNLHVTGIASINQLDVGTVTSGLNVTGAGITVAGISSISAPEVSMDWLERHGWN